MWEKLLPFGHQALFSSQVRVETTVLMLRGHLPSALHPGHLVLIPPPDNQAQFALLPTLPAKLRGDKPGVAAAASVVRVSPVARRLGGSSRDPNLDPVRLRRDRGQPSLEGDGGGDETVEEAVQRALAGLDRESAEQPVQREQRQAGDRDGNKDGSKKDGRDDGADDRPSQKEQRQSNGQRGQDPGGQQDRRGQPGDFRLAPEEQQEVQRLQTRDREVRSHERAHQSAAGGLAGAASFQTTKGPDGRSYAINGEVPIDVSSGNTPRETIGKAQRVRAAALAPNNPSSADRSIAARAQQLAAQARLDLARLEAEERKVLEQRPRRPSSGFREGDDTDEFDVEPEISLDQAASRIELTFRSGGSGGGHMHVSQGCPVCAAGIRAYQRS